MRPIVIAVAVALAVTLLVGCASKADEAVEQLEAQIAELEGAVERGTIDKSDLDAADRALSEAVAIFEETNTIEQQEDLLAELTSLTETALKNGNNLGNEYVQYYRERIGHAFAQLKERINGGNYVEFDAWVSDLESTLATLPELFATEHGIGSFDEQVILPDGGEETFLKWKPTYLHEVSEWVSENAPLSDSQVKQAVAASYIATLNASIDLAAGEELIGARLTSDGITMSFNGYDISGLGFGYSSMSGRAWHVGATGARFDLELSGGPVRTISYSIADFGSTELIYAEVTANRRSYVVSISADDLEAMVG